MTAGLSEGPGGGAGQNCAPSPPGQAGQGGQAVQEQSPHRTELAEGQAGQRFSAETTTDPTQFTDSRSSNWPKVTVMLAVRRPPPRRGPERPHGPDRGPTLATVAPFEA